MKPLPKTYHPAEYTTSRVPAYRNNPLIEALPPILSRAEAAAKLTLEVPYDPAIRAEDACIREHALADLNHFFQPLSQHLLLESAISRTLRFGYTGRNPLQGEFRADLIRERNAARERIKSGGNFEPSPNAGHGFSVVGFSGTGKTSAVERILEPYKQIIYHDSYQGHPLECSQLVWLKMECPSKGSVRALAINFFKAVDDLFGSKWEKAYAGRTTDELIPHFAFVASLHHLGLLVIDEIQHLSVKHSGGPTEMLNFFVELSNTIKVPMILIGTEAAIQPLSRQFQMVRRQSGQGEVLWKPLSYSEEWSLFAEALWRYQYTSVETELTEQLSATLHYESAGVMSYAVTIYMLAQTRVIDSGDERITPGLIHAVAQDSLKRSQVFLKAIREGDLDRLVHFTDLNPISFADLANREKRRSSRVPKAKHTASQSSAAVDEDPNPTRPRVRDESAEPIIPQIVAGNTNDGKTAYERLLDNGLIESGPLSQIS
jgi:hypothetical protein